MTEKIYTMIRTALEAGKKQYWVLLDPDDFAPADAARTAARAENAGAHAVLIGGSLLKSTHFDRFCAAVQQAVSIPIILFPGDSTQVSSHAAGMLVLSLLSGRNPEYLIGEQVKGAPFIKQAGLEPIPTAYMLVESGTTTSVEFMSNTRPLPANKPTIAAVHALAAQYMGQKLIYLEAGSGARYAVPSPLIQAVKSQTE
ncbi:MAG: geranylgeranylglyceryl/heptaprenylglyceryl phosphate synthase, partial [Fibrobacterota bacterium]